MKAYCDSTAVIMLCYVVRTFWIKWVVYKSSGVPFEMKAIERYFTVVLCIMLYKVALFDLCVCG